MIPQHCRRMSQLNSSSILEGLFQAESKMVDELLSQTPFEKPRHIPRWLRERIQRRRAAHDSLQQITVRTGSDYQQDESNSHTPGTTPSSSGDSSQNLLNTNTVCDVLGPNLFDVDVHLTSKSFTAEDHFSCAVDSLHAKFLLDSSASTPVLRKPEWLCKKLKRWKLSRNLCSSDVSSNTGAYIHDRKSSGSVSSGPNSEEQGAEPSSDASDSVSQWHKSRNKKTKRVVVQSQYNFRQRKNLLDPSFVPNNLLSNSDRSQIQGGSLLGTRTAYSPSYPTRNQTSKAKYLSVWKSPENRKSPIMVKDSGRCRSIQKTQENIKHGVNQSPVIAKGARSDLQSQPRFSPSLARIGNLDLESASKPPTMGKKDNRLCCEKRSENNIQLQSSSSVLEYCSKPNCLVNLECSKTSSPSLPTSMIVDGKLMSPAKVVLQDCMHTFGQKYLEQISTGSSLGPQIEEPNGNCRILRKRKSSTSPSAIPSSKHHMARKKRRIIHKHLDLLYVSCKHGLVHRECLACAAVTVARKKVGIAKKVNLKKLQSQIKSKNITLKQSRDTSSKVEALKHKIQCSKNASVSKEKKNVSGKDKSSVTKSSKRTKQNHSTASYNLRRAKKRVILESGGTLHKKLKGQKKASLNGKALSAAVKLKKKKLRKKLSDSEINIDPALGGILEHHKQIAETSGNDDVPYTSAKDVFAQLCQLENRSEHIDLLTLTTVIPEQQGPGKKANSVSVYSNSSLHSHVGGIWGSIFSK